MWTFLIKNETGEKKLEKSESFFLLFFEISVIGRNKRHDREERTQQFLSLSVTDDLKKYEKKYFSRVRC